MKKVTKERKKMLIALRFLLPVKKTKFWLIINVNVKKDMKERKKMLIAL